MTLFVTDEGRTYRVVNFVLLTGGRTTVKYEEGQSFRKREYVKKNAAFRAVMGFYRFPEIGHQE